METRRIKLTVAYDGTAYCGWQVQDNGLAVEAVINEAIHKLTGEEIQVIGASRTDSGVHAEGNVCVFDTTTRIPAEKLSYALNMRLPEDIRIQKSEEISADFHPRYVHSVKTYEYRIWNNRHDNPMLRLYTHFVYYPIDIDKMKEAAECLVGEHDFKSFCSAHSQVKTTVRRIRAIDIFRDDKDDRIITIRISGDGFLYNMVRIIVGTLLQIGMGIRPVDDMERIIAACDRGAAGPKAPAKGLTLVGIQYDEC